MWSKHIFTFVFIFYDFSLFSITIHIIIENTDVKEVDDV